MLVLKRNSPHWGCNQIPPFISCRQQARQRPALMVLGLTDGIFVSWGVSYEWGGWGLWKWRPHMSLYHTKKALLQLSSTPHPTKRLPATYWSMHRASQAPLSKTISPQLYQSLIKKPRLESHSGQMHLWFILSSNMGQNKRHKTLCYRCDISNV